MKHEAAERLHVLRPSFDAERCSQWSFKTESDESSWVFRMTSLPTQRNIKTSLVHVQSCLHVFAHESQCFLWPRMTAVQKDVSHLQEALQQLNERNEYADRSILVAVNGFVVRILSYRIVAGTLCGTHGASSAGSQFRTRWAMMAPVQFHIFLRTRFWHPKLITETKKGEQISELHKPSESMATFIIYI